MRFFEFSTTQGTPSEIKNLEYLLKNTNPSENILQQALDFLKKNADKNQTPDDKETEPEIPNSSDKEQPSTLTDPEQPPDSEPKIKEDNSKSLRDQLVAYATSAPEKDLETILYFIELNVFKSMADEIIREKIKVKAEAISGEIKLAIGDLAEKVSTKTMTDFLNDCKKGGVIDAEQMISGQQGVVTPIPISRPDYLEIVKRLLETNLGGASASGKGEFGLAFAGINATKGKKDITIGEIDVEVKASQQRKDFFFKGQTGFDASATKSALSKLIKALNSVGGKFQDINETGKGGIAQINPKTLNVLQPYFIKLGKDKVGQLLVDIINEIHTDQDISNFADSIKSSVNSDGSIDYKRLLYTTSQLSFYYYQQIEQHPGVLMLNITNMTYTYQENSKDFADLVASGTVQATSAIDFRTSAKGSLTFRLK